MDIWSWILFKSVNIFKCFLDVYVVVENGMGICDYVDDIVCKVKFYGIIWGCR